MPITMALFVLPVEATNLLKKVFLVIQPINIRGMYAKTATPGVVGTNLY